MNIKFDIDTKGLELALDNYVKKVETKLNKDVKAIAELIRDDIKENIFETRKVPTGKLQANAPFTIAKKGFDYPLVETGLLHDSISVRPITDGYEVYVMSRKYPPKKDNGQKSFLPKVNTSITTDVIASKNQKGYTNALGLKVPARPFFGIRMAIKKTIKTILNGR